MTLVAYNESVDSNFITFGIFNIRKILAVLWLLYELSPSTLYLTGVWIAGIIPKMKEDAVICDVCLSVVWQ